MKERSRFLTTPDWEKFSTPNRFTPRHLRELVPDVRTDSEEGELGSVIQSAVRSRLPRKGRSATGWFAWLAVVVKEGDGMSWSAEATVELLERQFPHFTLLSLSAAKFGWDLPLIANLVGEKRFFRLVSRHKLGGSFPSFQPWAKGLIWLVAIVIAGLLKFLDVRLGDLISQGSQRASTLIDFVFYCTVATFLGIVSQRLADHLTITPRREAVKELRDHLEQQAGEEAAGFHALVDSLASELAKGPFPRFLVIDNFEGFDLTTCSVLQRYLERYAPTTFGAELWVLFEKTSGNRLSLYQAGRKDDPYFHPVRVFEQLPLGAEERRALAVQIGHPERATYTTVGAICGPDDDTQRRYLEMLRNYQIEHPPTERLFGDLHLLYLLWLNFQGDSPVLEQSRIVSSFARKGGLRSELLASFLVGTDHRSSDFDDALYRLVAGLKETPLITVERKGATNHLTVHKEVGIAFDQAKAELDLPPAGLGHLFWAIFWFDRLASHPVQAFWVRKLATHLTLSDLAAIRDRNLHARVLERELEALIYTIRGALRTCIYEPLDDLMRRAVARLTSDVPVAEYLGKRLRDACWEAYILTGSDEALAGYLRLLAVDELRAGAAEAEAGSPLLRLFVDSLPLEEDRRAGLERYLATPVAKQTEAPLLEYGMLRSSHLVLTAAELLAAETAVSFADSARDAKEVVLETTDSLIDRLGSLAAAEVGANDLLSLSQSLDCLTLLLWRELLEPGDLPVLEHIVGAAETALLVAGQLRGDLAESVGTDLVRTALARELEYVVLTGLNLAAHHLGVTGREISAELHGRLLGVARLAANELRLPDLAKEDLEALGSSAARLRTDKLLEQMAFLWRRFGLHDLALSGQARRTDLLAAFALPPEEAWKGSAPLREALQEIQGRQAHTNLIGCMALARLLSSAAELRSDYFLQAAAVALGGTFGKTFKQDFAFGALAVGHHLRADLGMYLDFLVLNRGRDGQPLLQSRLETLDDEALEIIALRLTNAASHTAQQNLAQPIREMIGVVASARSEATRRAVQAVLEYSKWILDRREDQEDDAEVLQRWAPLRQSWTYAAVLDYLIEGPSAAHELQLEALKILDEFQPHAVTFNSYYLLALSLTDRLLRTGRRLPLAELPASYVRDSVPRWEAASPATTNERAYRVLYQVTDGQSPEYARKVSYWSLVKLQHDEASKLLPFLRQGRYFWIFLYYFELLASWGLDTDRKAAELQQALHLSAAERRERIQQWISGGRRVPAAFLEQRAGSRIASDFVLLGKYLFQPPFLQNQDFDDDRRSFDAVAFKAVTRLLDQSSHLTSLPSSILDLVVGYSRRFEKYSTPAEAI